MNEQGFLKIDRLGNTHIFGDTLQKHMSYQAGYYHLQNMDQDTITFKRVYDIPLHE